MSVSSDPLTGCNGSKQQATGKPTGERRGELISSRSYQIDALVGSFSQRTCTSLDPDSWLPDDERNRENGAGNLFPRAASLLESVTLALLLFHQTLKVQRPAGRRSSCSQTRVVVVVATPPQKAPPKVQAKTPPELQNDMIETANGAQ